MQSAGRGAVGRCGHAQHGRQPMFGTDTSTAWESEPAFLWSTG
jgi:hypothetical protein